MDVERLLAATTENPIELMKALAALEDKEPESLDDIVESKRITRQQVYYLLKIWKTLGHLPASRLAAIGSARLGVIARYCKSGEEGEMGQALADAEKYTARELRSILNGEPLPKARPHSLEFRLNQRQYKVLKSALLKYGARPSKNGRGLANKEAALTRALGGYR